MADSRRTLRERKAADKIKNVINEEIIERNEAYTKGAFKYLRLLLHLLGSLQFAYGIYYYCFKVHSPEPEDTEGLNPNWGGKLRFLTFLDLVVQAAYQIISLFNDLFGSNALDPSPKPTLRKVRDYFFAAWALPLAHIVCVSFWVIYAYDRELIFPAALDAIFPNWLNHIVHTNVLMFIILELFICFREYPKRLKGILGTIIFIAIYIVWLHIVYYVSGQWAYPILKVVNMPIRIFFFKIILVATAFSYIFGEKLNNAMWKAELELLQWKSKVL